MKTFGQQARERREYLGWSQEKLAAKISRMIGTRYPQSTVSLVENSRGNVMTKTMRMFAKALGCTLTITLVPKPPARKRK